MASHNPTDAGSIDTDAGKVKILQDSMKAALPGLPAVHAEQDALEGNAVHRKILQTDKIAQTVNPRLTKSSAAHSASDSAAAAVANIPVVETTSHESSDEPIRLEQSKKLRGIVSSSSRAFGKPGK